MLPPSGENPADTLERQRALDAFVSAKSVFHYLDRVVINSGDDPRPFGDVADPWQLELVAPKARAIDGLCGLAPYSGPRSFLTILPRGHDKSSLEGRFCNFALAFSRRKIDGYLCAADLDQAKLVIEAMSAEADLNPHLFAGKLSFTKYEVTGPAGRIKAIAADSASAAGLRGNFYICDEITHWRNDSMWSMLVSGREKTQPSILVAITNAGFKNTWQWAARQTALSSWDWKVFEREGQLASWMPADRVAEMRKTLPPPEAARLLDNKWLDLAEEMDYLDRPHIELCLDVNWRGHTRSDGRHKYVIVVDAGIRKDRCALLVMHADDKLVCRPDRFDVWQKAGAIDIQVSDIDAWLDARMEEYDPVAVVFDEWQMVASIQRQMKRDGGRWASRIKTFKYRGGAGNLEIAQDLRAAIMRRGLRWHPDQGSVPGSTVVDELANLVTRIMPYGYRFDHTADQHDDRAVALGMGLVECIKHPPLPDKPFVAPVAPVPSRKFSTNPGGSWG